MRHEVRHFALFLALTLASCVREPALGDAGDVDDPHPDLDARDSAPDPTDTRTDDAADTFADTMEMDPPLGMCGAMCGGSTISCPEGALCEYGVLDLVNLCTTNGCGLCAWIPDSCAPGGDLACGCNGEVYENACERRMDRAQPDLAWSSCPLPEPEDAEPAPDIVSDADI